MTCIFFYSILILILLSIFVPSIYNYAYKCFIGRIVLVLLIIFFSKHSILLGLVFVAVIIVTSMPLYEGMSTENILAKDMIVTSNTSIKDIKNNQDVFDYFAKYYCEKGSTLPNKDKLKRWNDILKSSDSDSDSKDIASENIRLQSSICSASHKPMVASIPELASYGCTKCQNDMFACTNLPQSNPLKSGGTIPANSNSLISTDMYHLYDAVNPSYTLEGKKYWWRQAGGCPGGALSQQSIIPFFKLEDAAGIKQGKYNNISFNKFGLNSNLNNWTITIIFSAIHNSSKWQGIIGNIYNPQIPGHKDGWGFWMSPYNYLHFRIGDSWAQDFTSLGQILENTPYKIIVSFNNNVYKIKLIRMSDNDNANNIVTISNKPKLTTYKGSICLGGRWQSLRTDELFDGNITYVDFMSPNLQQQAPDNSQYYKNYNDNWYEVYANSNDFVNVDPRSISGCSYKSTNHVLNTPGCLSENIKSRFCKDESITSIIPAAQNVSNNPKLDPYLQQDGQWMLNMYSQLCETSPVF